MTPLTPGSLSSLKPTRTPAIIGLSTALTILLLVGIFAYRSFAEFHRALEWAAHTHEVIEETDHLLISLVNAETGQRGYLITGEKNYLDIYEQALGPIDQSAERLKALTADNEAQQRQLNRLEPLIAKKLAGLKQRIGTRKSQGLSAASQAIIIGKDKYVMDEIRQVIAGMDQDEQSKLVRRQARVNRQARLSQFFLVFGTFTSFLLLSAAFMIMRREIAARRQAEEDIRSLNEALENKVALLAMSNKEMEAFSYSVSHDLRAPLRHISGFADMLQNDESLAPNETTQRYIKTIINAAKQMGRLIDDLLSFSRMGRAELMKVSVHMSPLVEEIRRDLQADLGERNVVWKVQPLPAVQGDNSMLRQVWVNLISNALKYTRTRSPAEIEIGSQPSNGKEVVFFVRDNGVGFNMKYVDKLFGVFQRLHSSDEFEGTGIGLANVRRIIYRHGGRTWAESVVDKGATFYFSLPYLNERNA
jgi:signal transduction histidine kinase